MINFIFTRKKLLVGVRAEKSDLLQFNGQSHIPFGNRNMGQTLSDSLPVIQDAYRKFASSNGIALSESLPTSIVFPVEADARDIHEVMHLLGTSTQAKFELTHTDDLVQTYLNGINIKNNSLKEPCIVLEALDDYLSVLYYFNTTKVKNHSFLTFKERDLVDSADNVIGLLEKEFKRMGIILGDEEKKELEYQYTLSNSTYFIQKSNGIVHLTATVKKSDLPTITPVLVDKSALGKLLSRAKLDEQGIKHIILLGDSLRQEVYTEYFNKELKIADLILKNDDQDTQAIFKSIVDGIYKKTARPAENKLQQEETDKVENPELLEKQSADKQKVADKDSNKKAEKQPVAKPETAPEKNETNKEETNKKELGAKLKAETNKGEASKENKKVEKSTEDKKELDSTKAQTALKEEKEVKSEAKKQQAPAAKTEEKTDPQINTEAEKTEAKEKKEAISEDKPKSSQSDKDEPGDPMSISPRTTSDQKNTKDTRNNGGKTVEGRPASTQLVKVDKTPFPKDNPTHPRREMVAQTELSTSLVDQPEPSSIPKPVLSAEQVLQAEWDRLSAMEAELKRQELDERRRFKELRAQIKKQRKLQDRHVNGNVNLALVDAKARLEQIFVLLKEFPREEFVTQLVMDRNLKTKKVLRFISNEDFSQAYLQDRFLYLYEKEAQYYKDLSNLFETEDGKFYFRDYLKGLTLGEHFKKSGLSKKTSLRKLNSKELEFIVDLIQTIEGLPVSHCNINEKNILIQEKRSWNLQNETTINLIGFTSDDCSNEEMVNRMHEILHQLLAVGVYSEFRNTLKL